jgi:hypothetical protein
MAKPLAGKRWFEALGRSDKSRGVPRSAKHYAWPAWAQQAYMRGRMLQGVNLAKVKPSNAELNGARRASDLSAGLGAGG